MTKGQLSNGGVPQGLIVHHTGGPSTQTPQQIANGWLGGNVSSQYIMGRDGTIYQMVPDGGKANHILPSWGAAPTRWASNKTAQGIELIARDDSDITPAQKAALAEFAAQQANRYGYSLETHVLGHGDVNGYGAPPGTNGKYLREPTEGATPVNYLRATLRDGPARTANPLGGPNGLSAADFSSSPPPTPSAPASFSIPALPPSSLNAGDSLAFNPISPTGSQLPLYHTDPATGRIMGQEAAPLQTGGGPNGLSASDFGFSTAPITPAGYNTVTDAQRTAMAALPPPTPPPLTPAQQTMMMGRGGNAPVAPIPATRPAGLGTAATPASPPPQMATLPTGKTIQVGKNYIIGDNQFIGGVNAQGVGTLTKVTSPLAMAAPNTIAGGIAGKAISGALSTAGTNLQEAAGVAGKDISGALDAGKNAIVGGAENAVNGVGGLLSNLFGGGGNAAPPAPSRPIPAPWNTNFAPTPQAATGNTIPSPPPAIPAPWQYAPPPSSSSNNNSPSFTFPNPPSTPQGYNTVTDAQRTAMAALPTNYSQAPAAPTYQNVTVTNPAYTTWVESYGDAAQAAARTANPLGGPNGLSAADFAPPPPVPPAPPATITVRRAVPAANSPAPQQPAPPPVQMVQLASGTMAPVGSISTNAANGYSYRVNADGSMTNLTTGHTYGAPTPTNNLATMGSTQASSAYDSGAGASQTPGAAAYESPAAVIARNALHPGQVGEWVNGMPLAWRGTINPTTPRTLADMTAPATPTPPPVPAPQSGANPVLSPPRFNGPPGQSLGANYPGPFPPNPSLNALSAWRQSHQDQPGQQSTGYGQNPQGPNTQFPLNPSAGGQPQQPWWQGQGQQPDTTQHQPWHPFGIDPSQVDAWHQFDHGPQGQMGQWWQNHQQQPPIPVPPQPQPQPGGSGVNWPNPGQGQPLNPIGVPNRY